MTEGEWSDTELARLRLEGFEHLAHLLSGVATERDAAEIVAWRMRSRAHEEAFRSAVRLSRAMQKRRDLGAEVFRPVASNDTKVPGRIAGLNVLPRSAGVRRQVSRRGVIGGAIAASVAGGVFALGRSMDLVPSVAELRADYRTGTGERRVVQLASGATVELNTRTSIGLRTDLAFPAVELISGEAIVTNARSGKAALVVGAGTSVGSGGSFNARRDGGAVCVTCLVGQVEVDWSGTKRLLGSGNQVRYDTVGIGAVLRDVDTAVVTAWKVGTLIFRNMSMRAVVDEINHYRPGKVILASSTLAKRSLSGTYYVNRLDEFFNQAELAFGATVTRLPGNIVVLS